MLVVEDEESGSRGGCYLVMTTMVVIESDASYSYGFGGGDRS